MKSEKSESMKPRKPRGFIDRTASEIRRTETMLHTIRETFDLYGFDPVETPLVEYTGALGKFLPDQDRPNAGVFSFQDDDEEWLSLRYDLTAPLARYAAEHFDQIPKPYRSYRSGWVFRNEKPGPGRFRQFMQFDADTVGAPGPAADAEICMIAADTLERLGIPRGSYIVRVNNRKVLDGVMETAGLSGDENAGKRLVALRAIDKLDRLGLDGVRDLLGKGRKDPSGDFTPGADLSTAAIDALLSFVSAGSDSAEETLANLASLVSGSADGEAGLEELREISAITTAAGYDSDRIIIDPSVVRGLEYYTGPVYEAELTFETTDETGSATRFGSVAGGGRYDGLVARFRKEPVPATGFSIGVSRLSSALEALKASQKETTLGPVVVLVMDKAELPRYYRFANDLRAAGIRAEMYVGGSGMRAQMKYADRRNAPCVVIQGSNERDEGMVQIKDLFEGKRLSAEISDNETWRAARPAQLTVPEDKLLDTVKEILASHTSDDAAGGEEL